MCRAFDSIYLMILDSIVDMVRPVGEMKRQPAYRQRGWLEAQPDVTGRAVAPHGWVIIAD